MQKKIEFKKFATLMAALLLAVFVVVASTMVYRSFGDDGRGGVVQTVSDGSATETDSEENAEDNNSENGIAVIAETEENSGSIPMLTSSANETAGDCYVSGLGIQSLADGEAPFDDDDDVGNDSSDSNLIVRSFDYLDYTLEYATALTDSTVPVDSGNLMVEFVLACDPSVAEFETDVLNWCNNLVVTYTYEDGTTSTTWDSSKTVVKQALTGYRALSQNDGVNAIPGSGTLNVSVYVKAAANGEVIQPSFTVWMEGNTDAQKVTVESEEIMVTAAPRYNIQLSRNTALSYLGYYDTESGTVSASDFDGSIYGRLIGYAITLQLYNTSSEKGLKGIELPSGDFSFDITISEKLDGTDVTNESEYTPILWDWRENMLSNLATAGYLGRQMTVGGKLTTAYGIWCAPRNSGGKTDKEFACYDGGTWNFTQDATDTSTYHVTVSGYSFDLENLQFPTNNQGNATKTIIYQENVGCFSAGYVQFIVQFARSVDTTSNLYAYAKVSNLSASSVSGQETSTDCKSTDNNSSVNITLYPTGSISKRNFIYSSTGAQISSTWDSGDAYAYPGQRLRIQSTLDYGGDGYLTSVNILQKFDDEAFEIPSGTTTYVKMTTTNSLTTIGNVTVLFAAKPDGSGWDSDSEMNSTREEQLIYFPSIDELYSAGYTCVGVLYEVRDSEIYCGSSDNVALTFQIYVDVKETAVIGDVYQTTNDVRAWKNNPDVLSWLNVPYSENMYGLGDEDWTSGTYADGYSKPTYTLYTNYGKAVYENGILVSGHSGGYVYGNSCLIVGCKVGLSIGVADTVSETSTVRKSVYDLDAGERTVTYAIQPTVSVVSANTEVGSAEGKTDVTITVTLPKGLTYITDSSNFTPESVTVNTDGTTTIVWTLEDQEIGGTADKITFACTIGAAGTSEDVQNNDTLTVSANAQSEQDGRLVSTTNGNLASTTITVVRLAASSISKTVEKSLVEHGEEITYTLNFGNNAEADLQDTALYDIMPYDGDTNGSDFSGAYTITRIVIDYTSAQNSWADSQSTIAASYTKDSAGRGSSNAESILDGTSSIAFSALPGTATQGTYTFTWDSLSLADVTGLLFNLGTVKGNEYISITITISPIADSAGNVQHPGDIYANSFYQYASNQVAVVTSNSVQAQVVNRVLSGLAWLDSSRDGIRGDSELLLSGLTAQVYRTTASSYDSSAAAVRTVDGIALYTAYDVLGNAQVSITTGDDGAYSWDYLEAGTYYIVISDIPDTYGLTEKDSGENDSVDSDAYGCKNADGTLQYVWIAEISLPDAEDMYSYYYESAHNDAGFLPTYGSITIIKLGSSNEALEGVSFTVTDTSGKVVAAGETDSEGKVVFEEMNLGTYEITETSSSENLTLLSSAITVTIPLTMTEAEVVALGNSVNTENGTLQNGVWYFYDLTYTITNSAGFTMPNAGALSNMPMPVFCGILGVCLVTECYWLCGWKRRKIEEISMIR